MKVCILGGSGKLGRYMVRHASERGYGLRFVDIDNQVEAFTNDELIRKAPIIAERL